MISEKQLARQVTEKVLEAHHLFNEAMSLVEKNGSDDEAKNFCLVLPRNELFTR